MNGVNGAGLRRRRGPAPGNDALEELQDHRDRQPVTVAPRNKASYAKNIRKVSRIATWNVRTLFQAGKLDNVLIEMDRMHINCLGLCEVRWPNAGEFRKEEKQIFYSGGEQHHRGVGLILDKHFSKSVLSFWPKNDRMLLVKLKASPFIVNILVIYAPTAEAEEEEINKFYRSLDEMMKSCKSDEVTIVMGDFNAKVGEQRDGKTVGPYGLGKRNDRGDKLVDWCNENKMFISNTWFNVHPRRRYTWTSPGDRARNQIDYILVRTRFRNAVKSSRSYPGADADSDHNPVVANFKLSLKKIEKPRSEPKLDVTTLKKTDVKNKFKAEVIAKLPTELPADIDDHWESIKTAINEAASNNIPTQEKKKQSSKWFTRELEDLLEKRRSSKPSPDQYRIINNEFRAKSKQAKEEWLEKECKEIEHLSLNSKEMFKKINEIAGKRSAPSSKCIKAADGSVLQETNEVAARWEEYIQDLFNDEEEPEESTLGAVQSGPCILKTEVNWAMNNMKNGKSCGPDGVYTEMLRALDEDGIDIIWKLVSKIYESGNLPKELLRSVFIALPKIPGTLDCASHRTISLMSHTLKLLLKIVLQRIRRKILPEIPEMQFGFMRDRGTRNAIFVLRMIGERAIEHQQDLFLCFIDYQKAFDRVRHKELFKILANIQIDDKDMRIIRTIYCEQLAAVRLPDGLTNWFSIKRGVRQGCVMSPDLFNLYSEVILRELEGMPEGITINGVKINNLRYADDTVLLANSEEELQRLFDAVVEKSERLGLTVNSKKTKVMVITKSETIPVCCLRNGTDNIEQLSSFKYLGAYITSDSRCKKEIRVRIGLAKNAFNRLGHIFKDRKLSVNIKIRLLKTFVWSTLMYGCESWTFSSETQRNIAAAEMWFYRRMLRISYMDRVNNEEVLRRVGMERELLHIIKQRQLKFLGHVIRKGALEDLSLTGKFKGKRRRGRRRKRFLDNFNIGNAEYLWKSARDRQMWQEVVRRTPDR